MSKRSKNSTSSSETSKRSEPEWVVADDGEASAESRIEREHVDEHQLDVVQQAPEEAAWVPVEPQDAPDAADAPRVAKKAPRAAGAKPARAGAKARKPATNDVATDAVSTSDEPAPSAPEGKTKRATKRSATQPDAAEGTSTQGDAGERKGTLAEEHAAEAATIVTGPKASPVTKKRRPQKFVAERAEQQARERADEQALERAADFAADRAADFAGEHAAEGELDRAQDRAAERAEEWDREQAEELARERAEDFAADLSLERADDASRRAPAPVARKKRTMDADEKPLTTSIVVEPEAPLPAEVAAAAVTDAPAEPASSMPSMETYIAELATMSVAQLSKRHVEVLGKTPKIKNRTWLQRKLAWYEQTKRYGGLSTAAKKRLDELMGEIELPVPTSRAAKPDAPASRSADDLPLGTRLERKWRDRVIVATRVEGGWDCEGKVHRTLSAAAKAVSGSHVSGPAWFGIWKPKNGGAQ
jgi:hypothetical protein